MLSMLWRRSKATLKKTDNKADNEIEIKGLGT